MGRPTIHIDEALTGIVGRNDFGKSTILEALAIFFEIEGAKTDKSDMNCFRLTEGHDQFEIACEFDTLPDRLPSVAGIIRISVPRLLTSTQRSLGLLEIWAQKVVA